MTGPGNPHPTVRLLNAALSALLLTTTLGLLPVNPANAAFPGANGKIVFVSTRDGNDEIYSMTPAGASQTRLTNNAAIDTLPAWSPDGTRIAFNSTRDSIPPFIVSDEIYVMNADGTNQTRLTNNGAGNLAPAWSPDGSRIAFQSNRDGNNEIYVMNADGTNPVNLTNNAATDVQPTWSPDGSRIAFVSFRDGKLTALIDPEKTSRTAIEDALKKRNVSITPAGSPTK